MYLRKRPTYTSIKVLYTAVSILMCQAAIFYARSWLQGTVLMMETGAGNRFQVPSPADGLAHVPGFTKLWRSLRLTWVCNSDKSDGLQVWTGSSVRVGWITEKCDTHVPHVYEFNRGAPRVSHKHTGRYFCKTEFPASKCSCWIRSTKQQAICVRLISTKACIHTITGNEYKNRNE